MSTSISQPLTASARAPGVDVIGTLGGIRLGAGRRSGSTPPPGPPSSSRYSSSAPPARWGGPGLDRPCRCSSEARCRLLGRPRSKCLRHTNSDSSRLARRPVDGALSPLRMAWPPTSASRVAVEAMAMKGARRNSSSTRVGHQVGPSAQQRGDIGLMGEADHDLPQRSGRGVDHLGSAAGRNPMKARFALTDVIQTELNRRILLWHTAEAGSGNLGLDDATLLSMTWKSSTSLLAFQCCEKTSSSGPMSLRNGHLVGADGIAVGYGSFGRGAAHFCES